MKISKAIRHLLIAVGTIAAAGCGIRQDLGIVKDCVLPADQGGTLYGKWRTTAVPIAFHQGDFTPAEMSSIMQAADTWNNFYSQSLGITAIDYGSAAAPRISSLPRSSSSMLCNQSITNGNGYNASVVLYKDGTWPSSNGGPSVIAITNKCRSAGTPLAYFFNATIEFNYQNFFVAGQRQPDLQSIILHEFGHLMGLDHSCEAAARPGMPSCTSTGLNPDYISASLFPSFSFDRYGMGQQKRALQSNDQGRANCLYMNFN